MEIRARDNERELLLELSGEIDHHGARNALKEVEMAIDAALPRLLTLDFSGVTFMDSSGIGVLIGRKKTMDMHRGEICARNLGERAQKIFDKSGLAQIILVESGREEKK